MKLPTKNEMEKDWGKKCKDFSALCPCCQAWHGYETLKDLYETKGHIKGFPIKYKKKIKFKPFIGFETNPTNKKVKPVIE